MVEVDVSGGAVRGLSRASIHTFVNEVIAALKRARALPYTVSEVSINFVDDAEMTKLNRQYRQKNKTTDVLTFEAHDDESLSSAVVRPLGDIVISLPQAARQAATEKHSLATEVRYLLLHGIVHAFGYDHESDQGEMNALEVKIRQRVGLSS
jgi:probable rRNA maturation factor